MEMFRTEQNGWEYSWRNASLRDAESYTAFFSNTKIKTNVVYTYETLLEVMKDPSIHTQVPKDLIEEAIAHYPPHHRHHTYGRA